MSKHALVEMDLSRVIYDSKELNDPQTREVAVLAFGELTRAEQLDLVRAAPIECRYDVLTLATDCTGLVRDLSPQETWAIISHKELQHSGALAAAASPKQLAGIMDIACWRGDRISEENIFEWLTWLAELRDELFIERIETLDHALLASALGPHMTVCSTMNPFNPQPSADGGFFAYQGKITSTPLAFDYDDDAVRELVLRVYEAAPLVYDDVIQRAFSDPWTGTGSKPGGVRTQRAEAAFLRAARMRKAGLPDELDARADLFQPLEVTFHMHRRESLYGVLVPVTGGTIMERMGAYVSDPDLMAEWQESLAWIASQVVVARGGDPGSSTELRRALKTAQSYVSVGLDALSRGCVPWAVVIAQVWDWGDIFRVGWSMAAPIRKRALSIGEELLLRGERKIWCAGLFEKPITVYDVMRKDYRLPNCAADLQRLARILSM